MTGGEQAAPVRGEPHLLPLCADRGPLRARAPGPGGAGGDGGGPGGGQ